MSQITDLVSLRQWLTQIADRVPQKSSHQAHKMITEVDDTLWKILFQEESPWASQVPKPKSIFVSDPNFDETIEKLREGRQDVRGQSDETSGENT